ncbi:MAG TPA: pyruvate kinase, partial [Candidatus Omnitrophota bacterium]|nr:pyruvate kinase [Candidatus Omnitrophota bacterium]
MKIRRQTGIICTLGPASQTRETILRMAQNGMDIARLNFSHGKHEGHARLIELIRDINRRDGFHIKILQDLEGYRMRVGILPQPLILAQGQTVFMSHEREHLPGDIPLDLNADLRIFKPGMDVFIDDGLICLKVVRCGKNRLELYVEHGGELKSRKGINIPDLKLQANILTLKDHNDLAFGLQHQVDCVAQSFVRNRMDIIRVRRLVQRTLPHCKIYAKIENREGVRNVDSIMEACDGIMVARGDLGVSLPIFKIPIIQKSIIRRCNRRKRYSITATQMLESMTENKRPTRAEVSDVANAILDGTDFVMLSAETAAGQFPVESVSMMRQIENA